MTSFRENVANGRREAGRNAIVDAAVDLYVRHGYENVSAEDITGAVGMSARTFYRYFESKDQVLIRFALRSAEYLPRAIAAAPDTEPTLAAIFRAAADWDSDVEDAYWTTVTIYRHLPALEHQIDGLLQAAFRKMLVDAIEARWPGRTDTDVLAAVVVGVLAAISARATDPSVDRRPLMLGALAQLRQSLLDQP